MGSSISFSNNKVNAATVQPNQNSQLIYSDSSLQNQEMTNLPDFDSMSVQELNNYIDKKVNEQKTFNSSPTNYLCGQSYI